MIFIINKDTFEENNIGYCVWKIYFLGILIAKVKHTTTQWDIISKLRKNNRKQFNINGFKK